MDEASGPVPPHTLVLGYGNPGRRDDGLGPALLERLAALGLPGVTLETGFQLNIEDAVEVSRHGRVVFVDASVDAPEPFELTPLAPARVISFTTHSVSAGSVLALAEDHFGGSPEAWQLALRGYDFEIGEGLTPRASGNLDEALRVLPEWLAAPRRRPD